MIKSMCSRFNPPGPPSQGGIRAASLMSVGGESGSPPVKGEIGGSLTALFTLLWNKDLPMDIVGTLRLLYSICEA
jgi:hypothetical protein